MSRHHIYYHYQCDY